jgi:hypothetical protein
MSEKTWGKTFFVGFLKAIDEIGRILIQSRIRILFSVGIQVSGSRTGSVSKCHGFGTLLRRMVQKTKTTV